MGVKIKFTQIDVLEDKLDLMENWKSFTSVYQQISGQQLDLQKKSGPQSIHTDFCIQILKLKVNTENLNFWGNILETEIWCFGHSSIDWKCSICLSLEHMQHMLIVLWPKLKKRERERNWESQTWNLNWVNFE